MDIPRTCGLLGPRELEITESWDVRGLLGVIARGEVKVVEVVGAFCKVSRSLSLSLYIYKCRIMSIDHENREQQ